MRLRTTAAALLASLALVLPTAGQSLANDHDGRESLGELRYRFTDSDGDTRRGRIEPADNDTCYQLTDTSRNHPAFEVQNDTESLAVLFEDRSCGGQAVETLYPGERARDLNVRSAFFKPSDDGHHGRHDHDGGWDDDRSLGGRAADRQAGGATDLFDRIIRSVG